MKYYLLFLILFTTHLFSQKQIPNEKIDSITYFSRLRDTNIKESKYGRALYYTQKAISYSIANNLPEDQKIQTYYLAKLYFDVKKYDDAIKAFNKSLLINQTQKRNLLQANSFYYIGKCYMKKKSFQNAEISFNQALTISEKLKNKSIIDLINIEKGIIYKNNGNFTAAISVFNIIIAKPDTPFLLDIKAEALYQIGKIEMDENRNNLALNYFKKALDLNSINNNLEQKSDILLALSVVYEKILDKSNAYFNLKQYNILKESISILDNERLGIDEYENFKELERAKELEILKKENIQKEKNNKFSKLISILAIALISILSLLSLALYKNNIIRKQSNLLLEEKNKELIIAKDKAIKASNARSEFLSTVSHELRTPLNAINGIAHLLLEEKPKKSQMHYLESLQFSGTYLTNFINDILEINKIDSNKAQIEKIPFNIKELLAKIQNSLKELATENNNAFSFEIDSEIPDYLIGDPTKISQIFLNLINNALKFTHNGSVMVITKLISLEDKKANLYFEVTDTGIGIPEDKLETIFDSFSQGSVGINRKYGGTGLGLTIVKKLVGILGGRIKLESTVGIGSSFSFQLPFKVSEKPLIIEENNSHTKDSVLNTKNILVVEDNKINQMVSKKMLENKGVICEIVDNGEEAIEIAKNYKYDMILMDIHLPGINGTIAAEKIREFDKITPIIALTAISLNENRKNLLSYGMNDVITKPFVPEEFYSIISKHI
ncbi:tetratricopeptide repeat-containing hybrid sensor histidine kinase/response regulator [Flavobacterium cellulosilyticum]|uniref:histidine kinase n=1 Tax=Flavobacterium cellulosilyticum TaxID=2541731 RepID=A0A4R5CDK0_9FLAO|nr:ATP-binding protein [Flavobacterium cellulosilyticum]TDD96999.1 response regulator [Flavobacterium cellulosilyticum]